MPMSATHNALSLIELASARLWHDVGPLADSLDRAVAGQGDVHHAAHGLLAGLRLRQAAWTPPHAPLPLGQLTALARGLPDRAGLDAAPLDLGTVFSPETGRIVLNLLLLGADSLPGGGVILLAGSADDLFIRITGPAAAWPVGLALCLADEAAARSALTDPAVMQMALTALLAHASGCRLSVLMSPRPGAEPPMLRLGG
jgi:hypothetical protein